MKINHYLRFKFSYLFVVLVLAACNSSEPMPQAPDYSRSEVWYTNVEQSPVESVDLFYVLPTCVFDWSDSSGVTYHYADVYNEEQRSAQLYSYKLADEIFGCKTNLYAPYYRQLTLNVWMAGESEVERLFPAAMADIDAAFDNFIETKNGGRPFILAGFSQGGKGVVELVKGLSVEERERMVAAYVIGYKVTDDDMQSGNIRGAKRASDTGVTICYNSVATIDAANPMISATAICINPVNWSTDETTAELSDGVRVRLNRENNILIVEGLDSKSLYVPELNSLFKIGNYHLQELELYKECLRKNVVERVDNRK